MAAKPFQKKNLACRRKKSQSRILVCVSSRSNKSRIFADLDLDLDLEKQPTGRQRCKASSVMSVMRRQVSEHNLCASWTNSETNSHVPSTAPGMGLARQGRSKCRIRRIEKQRR